MAVNLSNKYQSPERRYIRQIGGIDETSQKISAEDLPRQLGGIGEVWFQGNSAAGQSTGNGGGTGSGENPSGGGGSGGGSNECLCVDISEAGSVVGVLCCITGKSCETGEPIKIQTNPNNDPEPPLPCEEPQPPDLNDCDNVIFQIRDTGGNEDYFFGRLSENNLEQKCEDFAHEHQWFDCPSVLKLNDSTSYTVQTDFICKKETLSVVSSVHSDFRCKSATYLQELVYGSIVASPTADEIAAAVANWIKTAKKTKQYFANNGKLYDTCDPYGTPPIECVEMCDDNGNRYRVCGDGSITKIEE